ncbi:hypothetical protein STEG23_010313 [Scotinomys teguina]
MKTRCRSYRKSLVTHYCTDLASFGILNVKSHNYLVLLYFLHKSLVTHYCTDRASFGILNVKSHNYLVLLYFLHKSLVTHYCTDRASFGILNVKSHNYLVLLYFLHSLSNIFFICYWSFSIFASTSPSEDAYFLTISSFPHGDFKSSCVIYQLMNLKIFYHLNLK